MEPSRLVLGAFAVVWLGGRESIHERRSDVSVAASIDAEDVFADFAAADGDRWDAAAGFYGLPVSADPYARREYGLADWASV